MRPASAEATGVSELRESRSRTAPFQVFENQVWQERHPDLAAGITAAGNGADFGIGTVSSPGVFFASHAALARQLGFGITAMAKQVHGSKVVRVREDLSGVSRDEPHFYLAGQADGLLTDQEGLLLAVTAADCVPVYLVEPSRRLIGLLHAGWRGVAGGVLTTAFERLRREAPEILAELNLHLGPAICGQCYEVGPEVAEGLSVEARQDGCVDLRSILVRQALMGGIEPARVTVSEWCTKCGGDRFYSHRGHGGRAGRMLAYLGWRAPVAI